MLWGSNSSKPWRASSYERFTKNDSPAQPAIGDFHGYALVNSGMDGACFEGTDIDGDGLGACGGLDQRLWGWVGHDLPRKPILNQGFVAVVTGLVLLCGPPCGFHFLYFDGMDAGAIDHDGHFDLVSRLGCCRQGLVTR